MIIYCTRCWMENAFENRVCSRCGSALERDGATYIDKLVNALGHPEPETVQRAAWVLGEIKARNSAEALIGMIRVSRDPGSLEYGVEALGKIGDERALEILAVMVLSSYLRVRLKAVEAIKNIGGIRGFEVLNQVKEALGYGAPPSVSLKVAEAIRVLQSKVRRE